MMTTSFRPTDEQRAVIEWDGSALVVAGPGTGKTVTAVAKAKAAVAKLAGDRQQKVLFVSFSNAAVRRIATAAQLAFTERERRFAKFCTFHGLAMELLQNHGRFGGLPYRLKVADQAEMQLLAVERGWLGVGEAAQSKEFQLALARSDGLIGFDVMCELACRMLEASPFLARLYGRHYPYIIVDEFQDTSAEQWRLLKAIGQHSDVTAFGDPNQIIYTSDHSTASYRLQEFVEWKGAKQFSLSAKNFRCGAKEILECAEAILDGKRFTPPADGAVKVWALARRPQLRARLALLWRNIREAEGDAVSIAFLVPSNKLVEDLVASLKRPPMDSPVRFSVYASVARDEAAEDAATMAFLALRDCQRSRSREAAITAARAITAMNAMWNRRMRNHRDTLRYLTETLVDAAGGNPRGALGRLIANGPGEDETAFVQSAISAFAEEPVLRVTAARLRVLYQPNTVEKVRRQLAQMTLFNEFRADRSPKGVLGRDIAAGPTTVLTMHKAKGQEFDYVVIVCDQRAESSHQPLDEKRRLYYVAATRAKKWLGIVYYEGEAGAVLGPVLGESEEVGPGTRRLMKRRKRRGK